MNVKVLLHMMLPQMETTEQLVSVASSETFITAMISVAEMTSAERSSISGQATTTSVESLSKEVSAPLMVTTTSVSPAETKEGSIPPQRGPLT